MCVTVAVSFVESKSWAALTVTVCGASQVDLVNRTLARLAVTSVLSVGSTMVTLTVPLAGSEFSTTVYVPLPPSSTVSDVGVTVTPAVSSSVTVTIRMASLTES